MAKVNPDTLEPVHCRAGRAILNLSTRQLAERIGRPVTLDTLKALEAGRPVSVEVRAAILSAFDLWGIELLNGGRPGARVKDPERWRAGLAQGKTKPDRI